LLFLPSGIPFPFFIPFVAPLAPGELQLHPEYRLKRGMEAVLRRLPAGFDEFVNEKIQDQIAAIFAEWGAQLLNSPRQTSTLAKAMTLDFLGSSLKLGHAMTVNSAGPFKVWRVQYPAEPMLKSETFPRTGSHWRFSRLMTAEFQVINIRLNPRTCPVKIDWADRCPIRTGGLEARLHREQRIGKWELRWEMRSVRSVCSNCGS
jgi:hypothetical protein